MIIGKGAIDMSQRHFDYWSWGIDHFNNYILFVVLSKYYISLIFSWISTYADRYEKNECHKIGLII